MIFDLNPPFCVREFYEVSLSPLKRRCPTLLESECSRKRRLQKMSRDDIPRFLIERKVTPCRKLAGIIKQALGGTSAGPLLIIGRGHISRRGRNVI